MPQVLFPTKRLKQIEATKGSDTGAKIGQIAGTIGGAVLGTLATPGVGTAAGASAGAAAMGGLAGAGGGAGLGGLIGGVISPTKLGTAGGFVPQSPTIPVPERSAVDRRLGGMDGSNMEAITGALSALPKLDSSIQGEYLDPLLKAYGIEKQRMG